MILEKEIITNIQKEVMFLVGKIKVNNKYFIDKIEEGIKNSHNNFTTNVVGFMTSWDYFCNDKEFIRLLVPILDKIDQNKFIRNYSLKEAWGLKEGFSHQTKEHDHPEYLSGVIYLNNHTQELVFPQINQKVKPEKGKFVVFSSELRHKTNRNNSDKDKYALSFNFKLNLFK